MFAAEEVYERIKTTPFRPVRIVTASGQSYDVYHPDLVMVGRQQVFVGTPSADSPTVFENGDLISLLHITALENLPAGSNAGPTNGP